MNTLLIALAVATMGVDFGWERRPDGGANYIIQLSPEMLDALRDGQPVESFVMPAAGEVRSFRIVVGDEKLVRDGPLPKPLLPDAKAEPIFASQADFTTPDNTPPATDDPQPPAESPSDQPARPWLALTLTLFGLFASLGTNCYLGWLSWDLRRCRRAELTEAGDRIKTS